MTSQRAQDYISAVRENTTKLWEGWEALMELQREWNALDYGNTLPNGASGSVNDGVLAAEVGAVVFDTANAIKTVMDAGNATNIAKLL